MNNKCLSLEKQQKEIKIITPFKEMVLPVYFRTKENNIGYETEYDEKRDVFCFRMGNAKELFKEENSCVCLHCDTHTPKYCEECYQKLITENAKLQLILNKIEDKMKG